MSAATQTGVARAFAGGETSGAKPKVGMFFCGRPVDEMTREELINVIDVLGKQLKRLQGDFGDFREKFL